MKNECDLFEKFPDGMSLSRDSVSGIETPVSGCRLGVEIGGRGLCTQLSDRICSCLQLGTGSSWIPRTFKNWKTKKRLSFLGPA